MMHKLKENVFACKGCGKVFSYQQKTANYTPSDKPKRKYCSAKCREESTLKNRWVVKKCECCGKEYKTQNGNVQKYCSVVCTGKINKNKRNVYTCKKCGKEFYRPKRVVDSCIFCSRECAGNGEIGKAKTIYRKRATNARNRAKAYGVEFENIDVTSVFERDFWRCQICGKKTPEKNRGTKKANAPELDHRTPLSIGGSHTYDNVQCSCRKCNNKKSNKNSFGRIPLFDCKKTSEVRNA